MSSSRGGQVSKRKRRSNQRSRRVGLIILFIAVAALLVCVVGLIAFGRFTGRSSDNRVVLTVAYSPEKRAVFTELVDGFNATKPRLLDGTPVTVVAVEVNQEDMIASALSDAYQAISPDSSIWLGEIDRRWHDEQQTDQSLVGDTTRYMVSPVVIAMWPDVAKSLGYPARELGWNDLQRAASENPGFKWSHPATNTASGLLATLAQFYAGAGLTRGLTEEQASAQETLDYVTQMERTVKHYGEGELAVMQSISERGRAFLDAFVVQEQMVVHFNLTHTSDPLVAVYPFEGTLWEDHPLVLLEHPSLTDQDRLTYQLFKDYLLSDSSQSLVLQRGFRPADLSIPLDQSGSPINATNGADPTKPYTTLQIPGPSVVALVRDVWWVTKRQTNVYLVVDTSGSMRGEKLASAQMALASFLAQSSPPSSASGDSSLLITGNRVGLIGFATEADEIAPLTQVSTDLAMLTKAVDDLYASGNTALLDGVDLALTKLTDLHDAERINAIVVMTDGRENQSRIDRRVLSKRLQTASLSEVPIVVFCIAYGDDADIYLLESLSDASGGFTKRGDPETIRSLYKTLSTYF